MAQLVPVLVEQAQALVEDGQVLWADARRQLRLLLLQGVLLGRPVLKLLLKFL